MPLRKSYPSPLTSHFLRETLQHMVSVDDVTGREDCGDPIYGNRRTLACYITSSQRRIVNPQGETVIATWQVLFDQEAAIGVGALLTNGVDRDGLPLLSSAIVSALDPTISPDLGKEAQSVFCTER